MGVSGSSRWNTRRGTRTTPWYSPISTPNSTAWRSAFQCASSGNGGSAVRGLPLRCSLDVPDAKCNDWSDKPPTLCWMRRGQSVLSTFERYQRIAPVYDVLDLPFEYGRYRQIRRLLFQGLAGRLLDAGVGTGRNFPFYPPGSTVVGIDISPAMLARAERRRKSATAEVELRQMDVTHLDFADQTFDGTVATFLFCVLPDQLHVPALKELGRVVKAGGPVRLLEYVRPQHTIRRALARLWEPWIGWAYGASFDRRTEEHVPEAGLVLVDARFVIDELVRLISARVAS